MYWLATPKPPSSILSRSRKIVCDFLLGSSSEGMPGPTAVASLGTGDDRLERETVCRSWLLAQRRMKTPAAAAPEQKSPTTTTRTSLCIDRLPQVMQGPSADGFANER